MSALDEHDENVRIAVKALGDMRNSSFGNTSTPSSSSSFQPTPALSITSTHTNTPSLPSPSSSDPGTLDHTDNHTPEGPRRSVSQYPLVNTALKAYEHGKASSRVVKYGADLVESTAKTISKPVIDRLPVNGRQLDEFACRQIDRLGKLRRPSSSELESMQTDLGPPPLSPLSNSSTNSSAFSSPSTMSFASTSVERGSEDDEDEEVNGNGTGPRRSRNGKHMSGISVVSGWLQTTSPYSDPISPQSPIAPTDSRSPTPQPSSPSRAGPRDEHAVVERSRSRWQSVLSEAGGLGAAVSDESMRRLRYCLQWLQYATSHIDDQILILRDFIITLQGDTIGDDTSTYTFPPPNSPPSSESSTRTHSRSSSTSASHSSASSLSPSQLKQLTTVKQDVVQTIRQVVDVISKYAGSALPGPARARVKGLILCLPQKWAAAASLAIPGVGGGSGSGGVVGRRASIDYIGSRRASADAGVGFTRGRRGQVREKKRERGSGANEMRSSGSVDMGIAGLGGMSSSSMGGGSPGSSRAASPGSARREAAATVQAAQRILTLATESLDMMRGVTGVVKDSLERAEMWVGRLRVVGVSKEEGQDGVEEENEEEGDEEEGRSPGPGVAKLMGDMKLFGEMEVEGGDTMDVDMEC